MSGQHQGSSPNARFLAGDVPAGEHQALRFGNATLLSLVSHVVGVVLIVFIANRLPSPIPVARAPQQPPSEIVWLAVPGPGGGGGGGGDQTPEPPRKVEAKGPEKITVPVTQPPKVEAPEPPKEIPKPEQQITLPAQPATSGVVELPGAITSLPTAGVSQGPGSGGGAGTGTGTGSGEGSGSGLGEGTGGGFGGGVYRPGSGVISPRLLQEVKPNYTADAMRAKIQGIVTLEAVVLADGSVGPVRVTRSLDPNFGLDQEAERTVKKWRFAPGTRLGQPVAVLVEIEMTFTLR